MVLLCGCFIVQTGPLHIRTYLPQVRSKAHAVIESTFYRTTLTQTYASGTNPIPKLAYCFPLFDGVSVVDFQCQIGERLIKGVVKEREEAKAKYEEAVSRGESAGLLEQSLNSADVFQTSLGNVPANSEVVVTITYVGELKHDAEVDGVRFTIPTSISPRYGHATYTEVLSSGLQRAGSMEITVDVSMSEGSPIKSIQSPSHPISVSIGTISTAVHDDPVMTKGSATLSLGSTALEKDFILQIVTKAIGKPYALLETHPIIKNHRAIMATLVPNFSLKPERPEIIFVADRSGSMGGNIPTLISALQVFLKSLPMGVKFNLWSFGSRATSLWPKSKSYSRESLDEASQHVNTFQANFGGTETLNAMKMAIESREKKMPTEIMLLTDGDIWQQQAMFDYLNEQVALSDTPIRVFTIGIGDGVSTSLLEGVARAGNGFSQQVRNYERMEGKITRMLKGALSPHLTDCSLEIKYAQNEGDDFEIVEKVVDEVKVKLSLNDKKDEEGTQQKPISLYEDDRMEDIQASKDSLKTQTNKYAHLPDLQRPKLLQVPHKMPPLFPFNRTSVYILLSPEAENRTPESVVFRAKCPQGPLELEMKVQVLDEPGETIHQLAAKKAVQELEEGRGWLHDAKDSSGKSVKDTLSARFDKLLEREAVRLGVEFQVGGKWCSFVAVEGNDAEIAERKKKAVQNRTAQRVVGGLSSSPPAEDILEDEELAFDLDEDSFVQLDAPGGAIDPAGTAFGAPRMQMASAAPSMARRRAAPPSPAPTGRSSINLNSRAVPSGSLFGSSAQSSGPNESRDRCKKTVVAGTATAEGSSLFGGGLKQSLNSGFGVFGQNSSSGGSLFGAGQPSSGPSLFGGAQQQPQAYSMPPPAAPSQSMFGSTPPMPSGDTGGLFSDISLSATRAGGLFGGGPPQARPQQAQSKPTIFQDPASRLSFLVQKQSFDGSWGADVFEAFGVESAAVGKLTKRLAEAGEVLAELIAATAVAVAYLEKHGAQGGGGYDLMIEKARTWMEDSLIENNLSVNIMEEVLAEASSMV